MTSIPAWLLPTFEVFHFIGHSLAVGTIIYLDLRLLGMNKGLPVKTLSAHIIPWTVVGLLLAMLSGSILFIADIKAFWRNTAFTIKLVVMVLAMVNVAVFHFGIFRSVEQWDINVETPLAAKLGGLASIALWIGVIILGRLIAYF